MEGFMCYMNLHDAERDNLRASIAPPVPLRCYSVITPFTTVLGVFSFLLTDAMTHVIRPVLHHSSAKISCW